MRYYSTNNRDIAATLRDAVIRGLAPDRGLYMPESIRKLPESFFLSIDKMSLQEISYAVADAFFGEDIPADDLKRIVYDTMSFPIPVS